MPPLHLRQEFPTLKAFKEALHAWAIESHFEPRILKSDTGRVRVGCKRDPDCPFVIRCNWERKGGREPLARVTVLRERHTCLNDPHPPTLLPVLPKVQRNSASRLPFLMEILPRLMRIDKETTPVEIRECLLREYGAEVHLQQCRRAKTEILKKRAEMGEGSGGGAAIGGGVDVGGMGGRGGSADGIGSADGDANMFSEANMHGTSSQSQGQGPGQKLNQNPGPDPGLDIGAGVGINGGAGVAGGGMAAPDPGFELHTASGVVIPQVQRRSEVALSAVSEPAVRCPFCINHRWMRSVKDAVEHMSMHVVVS
ncbi:hypothetical protein BUE80_DR007977 [Diplocarpon rosae]|nr:hypothetical protein BUE80_DR007977 [Diplocarpon rosae]